MDSKNIICTLRNASWSKALILVTALYLLNVSIDPIDSTPSHLRENLSVNEIESIAELLIEEVAGVEDFFEEHDDSDSESSRNFSVSLVYVLAPGFILPVNQFLGNLRCFCLVDHFSFYATFLSKSTPPPKLA